MKYAVIILRYLRGYVHIHATGGFPERFLNLCHSCRINLWDVCLYNGALTFCISRSHFVKLRPLASKSGVKIRILKKTGIIYKYRSYSKRVGLATGVVLFAMIHLILSMFVWCVDVKGNNTVSKSEIISHAESYGLKAGTFKKSFDEIRAARNIAADYDGSITWMSVNIKGSLAVIELREDKKIISGTEDKAPCNIIADFDGVILSAETLYGDCMVKSGTGVKKGDLLINGAIINEDMSTTFYAAKGKITALHEKELSFTENTFEELFILRTFTQGYRIGFFGIEIPLNFSAKNEESILLSEKRSLSINGYSLPFSVERILLCKAEKKITDKREGSLIALEKMMNSVYKDNSNSTVVSKQEDVSISQDTITFNGKYTLIDFLGEEKPILSEE